MGIRGGTGQRTRGINLLAEKAAMLDYLTSRGYLTPRQLEEAREFAKAAMRRTK